MATSSELIDLVAEITEAPTEDVARHDSGLVDLGLRFPTMRGMSEPRMTPHDAANLILSVMSGALSGEQSARHYPRAAEALATDIQRCMDRFRLREQYVYHLAEGGDSFGTVTLPPRHVVKVSTLLSGLTDLMMTSIIRANETMAKLNDPAANTRVYGVPSHLLQFAMENVSIDEADIAAKAGVDVKVVESAFSHGGAYTSKSNIKKIQTALIDAGVYMRDGTLVVPGSADEPRSREQVSALDAEVIADLNAGMDEPDVRKKYGVSPGYIRFIRRGPKEI